MGVLPFLSVADQRLYDALQHHLRAANPIAEALKELANKEQNKSMQKMKKRGS